jgi:hypothetical protein
VSSKEGRFRGAIGAVAAWRKSGGNERRLQARVRDEVPTAWRTRVLQVRSSTPPPYLFIIASPHCSLFGLTASCVVVEAEALKSHMSVCFSIFKMSCPLRLHFCLLFCRTFPKFSHLVQMIANIRYPKGPILTHVIVLSSANGGYKS